MGQTNQGETAAKTASFNRLSLLLKIREGFAAGIITVVVVVHTLKAADGTRPPFIQRVVSLEKASATIFLKLRGDL